MAHALQTIRTGGLADAVLRFIDAALRWGFAARTREQDENRDRAGPLDVATMRDIGARHEYQDYAPSARVSLRGSAPPLHCRLGPVRITAVVFSAREAVVQDPSEPR